MPRLIGPRLPVFCIALAEPSSAISNLLLGKKWSHTTDKYFKNAFVKECTEKEAKDTCAKLYLCGFSSCVQMYQPMGISLEYLEKFRVQDALETLEMTQEEYDRAKKQPEMTRQELVDFIRTAYIGIK